MVASLSIEFNVFCDFMEFVVMEKQAIENVQIRMRQYKCLFRLE
jgi:hypothetical protein